MNPGGNETEIQQTDLSINDKLENTVHKLIGSGSQLEQLDWLCIILVITFLFKNVFFFINNVSLSFVGNKMIMDIRNHLFSRLQILPLSFFQKLNQVDRERVIWNSDTNLW